jgi:hypothetical protein
MLRPMRTSKWNGDALPLVRLAEVVDNAIGRLGVHLIKKLGRIDFSQ